MEKRSISEKVIPKASLKRLNGFPFVVPTPRDIRQDHIVKENNSPNLIHLQYKRQSSEQKTALPIISDYENKLSLNLQKAQLKTTPSAFQLHNCNNISAQKPLVSYPFLAIPDQQRNSANCRSPTNNKFRQGLTRVGATSKSPLDFANAMDSRENFDINSQRFLSTSKNNLMQNALRMSKLSARGKNKCRRNILSIDPIA